MDVLGCRSRHLLLSLVATVALFSASCLAADERPTTAAPAALAPGQLDNRTSRVYILVGKTGLGHEHGVEGRIRSGSLALGATTNAGQIVFDTTTFQADTPAARQYVGLEGTTDASTQRQVNDNMLGPAVLDIRRFSTATFKVDSIQPLRAARADAPLQYQLEGDFTLHGTTRKLKLIAEATSTADYVRLRGNFSILQSDFGITPYSKGFGAIGVADRLTIWGDLWVAADKRTRR